MILERIAQETGVAMDDLQKIVSTASHRYKRYLIPKRTGGIRVIYHPTPELKFLQRWLVRNVFSLFPVHGSVTSYRRGRSIVDNALPHVSRNYLLKLDFENFFPSITTNDVLQLLGRNLHRVPLSNVDMSNIDKIVCRHGHLTIGAPSSPIISNASLYEFDSFVFDLCHQENIIYTRYADDIFMSTNEPHLLAPTFELIRADLRNRKSPLLVINEEKTVFTSRKRRRIVTGVVLTSDGKLSVGRQKKRELRTLLFLYSRGEINKEKISYLRGYLAFVRAVEPELLTHLKRKFGDDVIERLTMEELVTDKYLD